ncbi:ribokinase [Leptolyngbya sp. 'hensonii']|uniref:sugar kinase n=1 Tax=Leptolyngbya sp. 'hensonii' TaxID=1922337 RepID=UPI0009501B18|nr:sugar kinase [Leptolyngbya sp. 'hensonii']OLP20329.1 ribokinase [Leptolyngbya sp. 'hensonii']
MIKQGLFVGMTTLDLVYLTGGLPRANQKIVATDYTVSAGGPATNAAVTFNYLGDRAMLLSPIGLHPISNLVRADLARFGVTIRDLTPTHPDPPPVSSILVTESTGDRAVVSINAVKNQIASDQIPANILDHIDVILIDGHQMEVGITIATEAKARRIPVVLDGGSWKSGFDRLLPLVDYALCSADFHPPNCQTVIEVLTYLSSLGIPYRAVSRGGATIVYQTNDQTGEIPVPAITTVDTLGAGDVLHGAFCHAILRMEFAPALTQAATIASHSCCYFGTRQWMATLEPSTLIP